MRTTLHNLYTSIKAAKARSDEAVAEGRRLTGWH
jgi:hypothetical protein